MAIERAQHAIICPGQDDASVLIALSIQDVSPHTRILAACRQEANAKLLKRAGVHVIVSPAAAGGNMLAAATRRAHLVETMNDILSIGGNIRVDEQPVTEDEIGHHPEALKGKAVIRVYRDGSPYDVGQFPILELGDVLVFITSQPVQT